MFRRLVWVHASSQAIYIGFVIYNWQNKKKTIILLFLTVFKFMIRQLKSQLNYTQNGHTIFQLETPPPPPTTRWRFCRSALHSRPENQAKKEWLVAQVSNVRWVNILQSCSESSDSDRFQNLPLLESRHDLAQWVTTSWSLTSQWNILSRYYSLFIQALKKFLIARNSQTWEREQDIIIIHYTK